MGQTLQINLPDLTYVFTIFTYQPYTVARMNYNNTHSDTHATIDPSTSEWRYDTNLLRIIRTIVFQGYLILIVSQIDLLSKCPIAWAKGASALGKGGHPHIGTFYYFDTQVCTLK